MSDIAHTDLITLIRLLHNDLPAAEGMLLRERLADDRELAGRFQTLLSIFLGHDHADIDEALAIADRHTAGDIAGFLDGQLSPDDATQFEQECWRSKALLQEVLRAWEAGRLAAREFADGPGPGRLLELATGNRAQAGTQSTRSTGSPDHLVEFPVRRMPDAVSPTNAHRMAQRLPRAVTWVSIAAAAIVVAVVLVRIFVPFADLPLNPVAENADPSTGGQPPRPRPTVPPGNGTDRGTRDDASAVHESGLAGNPGRENGSKPVISREPPDGQDPPDRPVVSPSRDSDPDLVPRATPSVRTPPLFTGLHSVLGVGAIRQLSATSWHGIQSDAAVEDWSSPQGAQILTWPDSRVTLQTHSLGELMIDVSSAVSVTAAHDPADPSDTVLLPCLEVDHGRIAILVVDPQARFLLQPGDAGAPVEVTETSSLSIHRDGGELVVQVHRGTVRVHETLITRRRQAIVRSNQAVELLPDSLDDDEWFRDRNPRSSLPVTACRQLNQSTGIAETAVAMQESADAPAVFIATQVLLQCSTNRNGVLPTAVMQRSAASPDEAQRQALCHWLVSVLQQYPGQEPRLMNAVLTDLGIAGPAAGQLTLWYTAAAGRDRPTLAQLAELASALRSSGHVFERQSAKFFLQQILSDPLHEYDPDRPGNRTAIRSVTAKMRAWQQQTPP